MTLTEALEHYQPATPQNPNIASGTDGNRWYQRWVFTWGGTRLYEFYRKVGNVRDLWRDTLPWQPEELANFPDIDWLPGESFPFEEWPGPTDGAGNLVPQPTETEISLRNRSAKREVLMQAGGG